jgi:hypothetical protein
MEGSSSSSKSTTGQKELVKHHDPDIPFLVAVLTYLSYAVLISYGHIRDFFANLTGISRYTVIVINSK